MNKKTVLVTGGAGFIGSHLCERLLKEGFKVISLDNYFTGSKKNHVKGVKYIKGHTKNIEKLVKERTISIVYHLGEYSRVAESIHEPETTFDLNLSGTFSVLEFCRKRKIKIVYAGSSTKFGRSHDGQTEGANLSPYTWAKAAMTDLVVQYGNWYNLDYAVVYFYNVYGERELGGKYGTVIQIFKEKYLKNEALPVREPGSQTRIYTHVLDTIDALMLVGQKGSGDGYGISASESYPILEVAKMFGNANIEMLPERTTSRIESHVNSEKIIALGWKQNNKLETYILDIVSFKNKNSKKKFNK